MGRRVTLLLLLLAIPAAFLAGLAVSRRGRDAASPSPRKILYYVDPMNPSFRSDQPGTAPCGMPLEPVYEESGGASRASSAAMTPGTVSVRPDRQQMIGLKIEPAQRTSVVHTMRLLGRVAPDERRLYRIFSVTEGWIRELAPATTGSVVKKDEVLASYYSQEILGPQQAFLYALEALDRFVESGTATPEQIELNKRNVRNTRQTLLNLGMSEPQTDEIAKSRQLVPLVQIRAPASGFVLARNVSTGQRFDRTSELYVIADLSRVWILADAFENEGAFFRPGARAHVRLPGQTDSHEAVVASVLPQFDAATRTLKVRLEADNPGYVFRPDMFADVELPVTLPEALVVPSTAVLDSGLQKTVFVDRGGGLFEPRRVETGWRAGGLTEIRGGLEPGDGVVVSGNFLLDSESRMRLAGAAPAETAQPVDPVCGMRVDPGAARADGRFSEHGGATFYFCAHGCKKSFDENPRRFLAAKTGKELPSAGHAHD